MVDNERVKKRVPVYAALALLLATAIGLVILVKNSFFTMVIAVLVMLLGVAVLAGLALIVGKHMKRGGLAVQIGIIVVAAIACLAVLVAQIAQVELYYPNSDEVSSAELAADPAMEHVSVDGAYSGWFVHNADGRAPLVLFFGGNGNCASRLVSSFETTGFWQMEAGQPSTSVRTNYMMIDYPGYGQSSGRPSQNSIFAMALAAYDYAASRPDVDPARIIVEGYSLGTGPATYLASGRNVAGLVLFAPYDTGVSLYNSQFDIFHGPMTLLVTQRFDSASYAEHVAVSPLIITSTSDATIDHTLSEALATHFPQPADLHVLSSLGHEDYFDSTEVRALVGAYVEEALS